MTFAAIGKMRWLQASGATQVSATPVPRTHEPIWSACPDRLRAVIGRAITGQIMHKLQRRFLGKAGSKVDDRVDVSVEPGGVPARRLKHILIGHDADPASP
jgi:hypothetical protein